MDPVITAAARALATDDVLGALKHVALRDDPPALALRGIAMARLGDLDRAKTLLRAAAGAFGANEAVARARCVVAEAEIALVSRDLGWPQEALDAARATLEAHGDHLNATHARHLALRRELLLGHLDEAERLLVEVDRGLLPPAWRAAHELAVAGLAIRRIETKVARAALARAGHAARAAGIGALVAEVERALQVLDSPAARLLAGGKDRLVHLDEVEALFSSDALVVDACRHVVRTRGTTVSLATRSVLFELARALGESWPGDVPRATLLARACGTRVVDESHRQRLRVEIARLRREIEPLAKVNATRRGFVLEPHDASEVAVLAPTVNEPHAGVLALLADGETWSSSALAMALGVSPRTVQRGLKALAALGKVQSYGRGRARRWMISPVPGFPTVLLLPGPLPDD